MKNIVDFKCTIVANPFNSNNFKIYGAVVDKKQFPNIKTNQYDNVTVLGNLHDLGIGIEYAVRAEEENGKYGYQYKVLNIKRDRPTDKISTEIFLSEILTPLQVRSIMSVYPDIVDKVMNNKLEDIDLNKLYDIGEYRFNVIKRKIEENFVFAELIEEFKGLLDFKTLQKLYAQHSSIKAIKKALQENPYRCLMQLARIGFKTADGKLLELEKECKEMLILGQKPPINFEGDLKTSKQREEAVILYLLEENENSGNTKITKGTLKNNAEKLAPACSNHFKEVIEESEYIYYDKKNQIVAIKNTYDAELYIKNKIIEALNNNIIWNFNIDKYKSFDGINLTNDQFSVLNQVCKYNVSVLNGFGGCGKSQTTKAIINMLKDNYKSFLLLAPTGRASKVLSKFTNEPASTIHRALGIGTDYKDRLESDTDKLPYDVIICDESSMCDVFLTRKLMEFVDFSKTKLLIVGDSAQIPSVGAGNILHDLINSKILPITTLTKVFRYGSGGILTVATKVRQGEEFLDNNSQMQVFGEDKSYVFIPVAQNKIVNNTVALYKKLLEKYKPEDILVLSSYNKGDYGTVALNNYLQVIANENAKLNQNFIECGEIKFFKNDLVIQIVNNYEAEIYKERSNNFDDELFGDMDDRPITFIPNGEIGVIKDIKKEDNKDIVIINFDDKDIAYDKSQLTQLKLAYSISTHKSQGGQAKVIILLTPKAHTFMLNSNLIYVGQTRAEERVYHLGEIETVNKAVKKKADFNRNTFLKDLLLENKIS